MTAQRKIKLLYIIAYQQRWPLAEALCRLIDRRRFDVTFILLHASVSPLAPHLEAAAIPHLSLVFKGKRDLPRVARGIYAYCRARAIDIVHAHFMNACLGGLLAAKLARVPVRIHTRHHAGPLPWSHREPWGECYDRWNNRYSTGIIAPCKQARDALVRRDGVRPERVTLIHHGFDVEAFAEITPHRVAHLREKYGLAEGDGPIIGVAARYERIKGMHHIVPAFARLLDDYPRARLVLANARGAYRKRIRRQLADLPAGRYLEIAFEDDVHALYRLFDLFVHVPTGPRTEGFGQVYVEALAAGVPAVFTRAGVAAEFPESVACFVDFNDSGQIYAALTVLLGDEDCCRRLARQGRRYAAEHFAIGPMVRRMETLYDTQMNGGTP